MKYKSIIAGILVFLVRYIPVYKVSDFLGRISLNQGNKLCSTFLGAIAQQCNWVTPLNWAFIIVSAGLIIYGLSQIEWVQKTITGGN